MAFYSDSSRTKLLSTDSRLICVCADVIRFFDHTVTFGHRTDAEQEALWAQGRTLPGKIVTWARAGQSYHNSNPSLAVDLAPYKPGIGIDWDDEQAFIQLAGAMLYVAWLRGIPLEWGGHWEGRKKDLPHYQVPRLEV